MAERSAGRALGGVSATDVVRGLRSLSSRDPLGYQPHRLHGHERTYQETNCSRLRISLYRECEQCIHETEVPITLRPHESTRSTSRPHSGRSSTSPGRIASGPPGQDLVALTLSAGDELLSQSFRLPAGRPTHRERAAQIGVTATLRPGTATADALLEVATIRFAYGVRLDIPGFTASGSGSRSSPAMRV
jgi:hypothetical protein